MTAAADRVLQQPVDRPLDPHLWPAGTVVGPVITERVSDRSSE